MKPTSRVVAAIALSLVGSNVRGASPPECGDLPDEISVRGGTCAEVELQELQQAELRLYRELVAAIPSCALDSESAKQWRQALVNSEQRWKEFVSSDCSGSLIFNEWQDGTGGGQAVTSCLTSRMRQRMQDLRDRSGYYRGCGGR